MFVIHFLFWFSTIVFILIFVKYQQYGNALVLLIGSIFIGKFHLIELFFNISTFEVALNYFRWLVHSSSLISLLTLIMTMSIVSKVLSMCKQWIKFCVLITILYWLSRWKTKVKQTSIIENWANFSFSLQKFSYCHCFFVNQQEKKNKSDGFPSIFLLW